MERRRPPPVLDLFVDIKYLRIRGCSWRRILAPSVYIFFCSAIPALAFGEQFIQETGDGWQHQLLHVLPRFVSVV